MAQRDQLLIVTPHSSGQVPADILREMLGDDVFDTPRREALLRRLFVDGDPYTDLIFALPGARFLPAPWSRFAVDLNRTRDDRLDNGVLKLTTFDREPLYPAQYRPSEPERERRMRRIWDAFDRAVREELRGARLMIVGHCMAPRGPKLGQDVGNPRPAICLMPGTRSAPTVPVQHWDAIAAAAERAFAEVIQSSAYRGVEIGVPWTTDTLSAAHAAHSGVPAFGIEFNSGLYFADGMNPDLHPDDAAVRALALAFERFADDVLLLF